MIYHFSRDYSSSNFGGYLQEQGRHGVAQRCPDCGEETAPVPWLPPHCVELEVGQAGFEDVMFGTTPDLLVSERLVGHWRDAGLSGLFGFEAVQLRRVRKSGKRGETSPNYFHVGVAMSEVAVDQVASGLRWRTGPTCRRCEIGRMLEGWERIILSGAPDSDAFRARGLHGEILLSERARDLLVEHGISGGRVRPADEASFWWSDPAIWRPR